MKRCPSCGNEFPATAEYFNRDKSTKDGFEYSCKACSRERSRVYHEKNSEKVLARKRQWLLQNRETSRARCRHYREQNRERERERSRQFDKEHPEMARERDRRRRLRPGYQLHDAVSSGVRRSLAGGKNGRSWESLVGYTREELIQHLEAQFVRGMTWGNYGMKWHIDHIRPVSDFNFESPEDPEFKECWSLWNLRPLWGKDNMSKGAKCETPPLPLLTKGGRR